MCLFGSVCWIACPDADAVCGLDGVCPWGGVCRWASGGRAAGRAGGRTCEHAGERAAEGETAGAAAPHTATGPARPAGPSTTFYCNRNTRVCEHTHERSTCTYIQHTQACTHLWISIKTASILILVLHHGKFLNGEIESIYSGSQTTNSLGVELNNMPSFTKNKTSVTKRSLDSNITKLKENVHCAQPCSWSPECFTIM